MVKTTHADSMLPFLLQAHVREAWQELDSPPKAGAVGPHCVLQPVKAARVMRFAEAMQIIQKNAPVSVLLELRSFEYDRDKVGLHDCMKWLPLTGPEPAGKKMKLAKAGRKCAYSVAVYALAACPDHQH